MTPSMRNPLDGQIVAIWCARLARGACGLDLAEDDDRATFRARVAAATTNLRTEVVRSLADYLQSTSRAIPRSHEGAARALADAWIAATANE